MDSITPYHLPAIIVTLLGVSALLFGGWGVYTAIPDSPKYHYSVSELNESPSDFDQEVKQFTNLTTSGQEVFLKTLDEGEYNTDRKAIGISIGTDYTADNIVEYQNQTYGFSGGTNYSGWRVLGAIFLGGVAVVGLITTLLGVWWGRENRFKLPTAVLSGLLAGGLLRMLIITTIEPPRAGYVNAILALGILTVPILVWYLLSSAERYWDTSFSQRMAQ